MHKHSFLELDILLDYFCYLLNRLVDFNGRFISNVEVPAVQVLSMKTGVLSRNQVDHHVNAMLLQQFEFLCRSIVCLINRQ